MARTPGDADIKITALKQLGLIETAEADAPGKSGPHGRGTEHRISAHNPLWAYCHPALARPYADPDARPLFDFILPDTSPDEALAKSNWTVFIGAAASPLFSRAVTRPGAVKLVFEPDTGSFRRFIREQSVKNLAGKNTFFFIGDVERLRKPLLHLIPPEVCNLGFPVFFIQEGLREQYPGYAHKLTELLEVLYYRNAIYPVQGSWGQRSIPLRDITRSIMFDQQKHVYDNITDFATCADLSHLRNRFEGFTAILVGAGPDLENRLEYIKNNRDKALVVCVNNALRVLTRHGIKPHFTVINDSSVDVEKSFEGLSGLDDCILVAHCMSATGTDAFGRKLFFGNFYPQLFGTRPELRIHASVITTAFSLAGFLGCKKSVLVGVQLASHWPWSLLYSRSTIHGKRFKKGQKDLIHKYPQLYPSPNAAGQTMYTSPNFLDASIWFRDLIRVSNMEVVNTTPETLIHGPGITIDPEHEIQPRNTAAKMAEMPLVGPRVDLAAVEVYIQKELKLWTDTMRACRAYEDLVLADDRRLAEAGRLIDLFDKNNTTFMVQRFQGFKNSRFTRDFFGSGDPQTVKDAAAYYFKHAGKMAGLFVNILEQRLVEIRRLKSDANAA